MRQTHSTITMLIKAYKAVLHNCFINNLLIAVGGGKAAL